MRDKSQVFGHAHVSGSSWIGDKTKIQGNACVKDSRVFGRTVFTGFAACAEGCDIRGDSWITGDTLLEGCAVHNTTILSGSYNKCSGPPISKTRGTVIWGNKAGEYLYCIRAAPDQL